MSLIRIEATGEAIAYTELNADIAEGACSRVEGMSVEAVEVPGVTDYTQVRYLLMSPVLSDYVHVAVVLRTNNASYTAYCQICDKDGNQLAELTSTETAAAEAAVKYALIDMSSFKGLDGSLVDPSLDFNVKSSNASGTVYVDSIVVIAGDTATASYYLE